jgi:multiple sugar transport system permease protein
VRQGPFRGLRNYGKALGEPQGILIFAGAVALLLMAAWMWRRARQTVPGHRLPGLLAAVALLTAAGAAAVTGWGRMLETGDVKFLNALPVTVYYALGSIPLQLAIALALACVLFQNLRGSAFFRMVFFLPYVMPTVATATVFRSIFSPRDTSMANQFLALFGLEPQQWLAESRPVLEILFGWQLGGAEPGLPAVGGPSLALVSIILFGVWTFVGYNVVIFLAGLGSISGELYEAAELDGANRWDVFRHITFPLLSPITFYLALIDFIGALKAFNHIFVMRSPLAQGTVNTASMVIFDTFYLANQYGYAAAQVVLLFLMILGVTYAQNRVFGRSVIYD